jgi:uncharacterized membrane protein YbhN (UPF0104 family)
MSAGRYRRGQILRILFGVAGLFFMGIVFRDTWNRSQGRVLPGWEYAIGAEALMVAGLAGASRGWVSLFDGQGSKRALARAFYAAQLGKYVPGAIWQAVGQVGLSRRAGVSLAQATVAFPVHALTWLAASGTVGAALAVLGFHLSVAVRLVALLGLLLVLPLRRTWMLRVLAVLTRLLKRGTTEALPSQAAILRCYGWGIWTHLMSGAAFALLASSIDGEVSPAAAIPAFALAWTIGFLALPFPAGLGIRELVLIATLASSSTAAPVIAASLAQRLVTMVGELVMILFSRVRRWAPQSREGGSSSSG